MNLIKNIFHNRESNLIEQLKFEIIELWTKSMLSKFKSCQYYEKGVFVNKIQIDPEIGKVNALIDSHFNFLKSDSSVWNCFDYIETLSSKGGNTKMKGDLDTNTISYKVREAILTNVYIYDEVLQNINHSHSGKNDPEYQTKSFRETLAKKGIHIPHPDSIDLRNWFTGTDQNDDHTMTLFKEKIEGQIRNCDMCYVIIHYSGFEKLAQREAISIEEAIKSFVTGFKHQSKYIVFTSGKNPSALPDDILFINRNSLENLITIKNSKFELISLLNNLRYKSIK